MAATVLGTRCDCQEPVLPPRRGRRGRSGRRGLHRGHSEEPIRRPPWSSPASLRSGRGFQIPAPVLQRAPQAARSPDQGAKQIRSSALRKLRGIVDADHALGAEAETRGSRTRPERGVTSRRSDARTWTRRIAGLAHMRSRSEPLPSTPTADDGHAPRESRGGWLAYASSQAVTLPVQWWRPPVRFPDVAAESQRLRSRPRPHVARPPTTSRTPAPPAGRTPRPRRGLTLTHSHSLSTDLRRPGPIGEHRRGLGGWYHRSIM